MYIVELEPGVYLAGWGGDPGRTLVKESALQFSSWHAAKGGVRRALQYRKFKDIAVIPVPSHNTESDKICAHFKQYARCVFIKSILCNAKPCSANERQTSHIS